MDQGLRAGRSARLPQGGEVVSLELAARTDRSSVTALARAHAWPLVVWTAMIAWSLALFGAVRSAYLDFQLARYDLGNMVQAVWSTAHGRPLEVTDATGEQMARLGGHVDPILALLAPLWSLAPTPLTLAAVQVTACALGAVPVLWLGRRHLGSEPAAALLALAYLAYPWLAWTALDAIHPVTFAIPLFLFAIWFLDTSRYWAFVLCAILVLATGELMGLPLAALGLWHWLAGGQRRAGLAITAAGMTWTLVCLLVIVPAFRSGENPFYGRYASVGGSPQGILKTVFTDPGAIVSALGTGADVSYLVLLAAPLAGAFLFGPALAAVALPQLLLNGLSDWPTTTDPRHHYVAGVIPFLFAGAIFGLARLPAARRTRAAAAIFLLSTTFAVVLGPTPVAPGTASIGFQATLPRAHIEALRSAVSLVPEDAAVTATNRAGSHLSARRHSYSVPTVGRAKWALIDTWNAWMPASKGRAEGPHPELLRAFLNRIQASPRWRQVFERDGVFVFERSP
jgi:uncharacterized membrane protein